MMPKIKKLLFVFFVAIAFLSCKGKREFNEENFITDDLNNKIELANSIKRAVSLAPNLTEIIFFIDAEDFLVANTLYCNFPPKANEKIKIGDLINIDYEKLLELKPDIILMTTEGNTKAQYSKLKSLGFTVFVSDLRSFNDILRTINLYGKIFNKRKIAEEKSKDLLSRFNLLKAGNKIKGKGVFFISVKPLIAAGKNTFINEYIEASGLENAIAKNNVSNYPIINYEELINVNPDFIIIPNNVEDDFLEILKSNDVLNNINAIKDKRIISVNPNLYFRPGPRFVDAFEDLILKLRKLNEM